MVQEDLDPLNEDDSQLNQSNMNGRDAEMVRKMRNNLANNVNIYMNSKNANQVLDLYDKIMRTIEKVQRTTAQALDTQRNEICEVLDNRLEEIKKQIKDEKAKKGDSGADFKEREKELNDHLETMTQIAQKIDFENRELMKKNVDLNIQVKSQEQDKDILLQQLLYEKKEGKKIQQKLRELKEKAELLEQQQLEEQGHFLSPNTLQSQLNTLDSKQPNQNQQELLANAGINLKRVSSNQSFRPH